MPRASSGFSPRGEQGEARPRQEGAVASRTWTISQWGDTMRLRIPIILGTLVGFGCSDSSSPIPVASVQVTPAADTVRAGETVTLVATPRDADGNALAGRPVTWGSGNTGVATVNAGVVTGVAAGTAMISATSEGHSDNAAVTVWVGITGSWTGTVDVTSVGSGVCPLNPSLTEAVNGDVAGAADLGSPCAVLTAAVLGTNNTGGVADSVVLFFDTTVGDFMFNGNFDGSGAMTGMVSGSGCTVCPASFTRSSIVPGPVLMAARAAGTTASNDPFLRR